MSIAEKRKFLEAEFVSDQFGLIKGIRKLDNWKSIRPHVAIAEVSEVQFIDDNSGFTTSGLSLESEDEAVVAAIMEGLERYSSTFIPEKELKELQDLSSEPVENFYQKLGHTNIDSEKFYYTEFWDKSGSPVYLPAQYAYFKTSRLGEKPLIPDTTNGLAAHSTKKEARKRALMELVEREAILRMWINRIAPPRIKLEGSEFEQISKKLSEKGYELTVFRINFVPNLEISFAVLIDPDHRKSFISVGAESSFSLKESVGSAIEECLQARIWEENYYDSQPGKPKEVTDTLKRSKYWASEKDRGKIDFLYQNDNRIEIQNNGDVIPIEKLELPNIYFKDVSTDALAEKDIYVFRAFCPDFNPFYLNEQDGKSSKNLCEGKEIEGEKTGGKINNIPHPML